MPANLGPDYLAAEREYREAQTGAEKIAALEQMFATLPKHKGTEKLQADIRKKLSQARKDAQKKGITHATPFYIIPREGAGQVALAGPPNCGKSQLIAAVTHAHPEVAPYPFTTRLPLPGMLRYEDASIQLIDLPPISEEFTEPWLSQTLRRANAVILLVDAEDPHSLAEIEYVAARLDEWRVAPPKLLVGTKLDAPGGRENFAALEELYGAQYRCLGVSAVTGENLDAFARAVFELLDVVRVYTKIPGQRAGLGTPYILRRGETVLDAARHVHKDFAERLKYARLFRPGGEHSGRMVERDHVVADRDILEFHI